MALNVYVALCYYKLDYYDVSQEVLAVYLQHFPDSAIAINLKGTSINNVNQRYWWKITVCHMHNSYCIKMFASKFNCKGPFKNYVGKQVGGVRIMSTILHKLM